jgi:hypothetical protein
MQTTPVLKARLLHAAPGERVVQVSAWQGERCLGSCLGEASNAEEAEQRATTQLLQRLGGSASAPPDEPTPPAAAAAAAAVRHPVIRQPATLEETATDLTAPEPQAQGDLLSAIPETEPSEATALHVEPASDPDDWSDELAELDVQLQRIGWDRAQEGTYLQRAFGHPSRNRLTAYADLVSYLRCLRNLPSGCDAGNAPVPLRRKDLLEQCDQLLRSLQWDASRGRQLLEQQFQLSSRQQLSDEQLLQFNMLLEEALIQPTQTAETRHEKRSHSFSGNP